jgi:CDGSH-type Zn-finger protein
VWRVHEVEIRVRDDGPYKVTGPVRLVDPDGNEIANPQPGRPIVLCRCGQSHAKPFCDAAHKASGFASCVRAESLGRSPRIPGENSAEARSRGGGEGTAAEGAGEASA